MILWAIYVTAIEVWALPILFSIWGITLTSSQEMAVIALLSLIIMPLGRIKESNNEAERS